jgi:2-dehydro-3-deoxygluconokinase
MRVASIGECMVEFSAATDGLFARGFGGDTLNTALYLARLGVDTSYVTALGDDPLSDAMLAAWKAEGIKTDEVMCLPGRLPGLYMIERDARGERSFLY